MTSDIQERVETAKRDTFLHHLGTVAGGDPSRFVPCGDLGQQMGLPYEESLRLAGDLSERGMVSMAGGLEPPHGPRLHLTPRGVKWLSGQQSEA